MSIQLDIYSHVIYKPKKKRLISEVCHGVIINYLEPIAHTYIPRYIAIDNGRYDLSFVIKTGEWRFVKTRVYIIFDVVMDLY